MSTTTTRERLFEAKARQLERATTGSTLIVAGLLTGQNNDTTWVNVLAFACLAYGVVRFGAGVIRAQLIDRELTAKRELKAP